MGSERELPAAVAVPFETAHRLTWRDQLEQFFEEDLDSIRVVSGPAADEWLDGRGLVAAARGSRICLSARLPDARPAAWRSVLAHEVAHVLQQTRGARWAGRHGDDPRSLEREAHLVGAAFGAGLSQPARAASTRPLGELVQGHDSFEHRLLGDTPTAILSAMVAGQATPQQRQTALGNACDMLAYLGENWSNPNPATLAQLAGFPVRLVQLKGSGLQVTYGELNTMADYLTNPTEIDSTPQNVLLPILQMIREAGYDRLNALRSTPGPRIPILSDLIDLGSDSVAAIKEGQALDALTTGLGPSGRDHYYGLLARNACHFAPFTWWRWQASYAVAVSAAQAAYHAGQPAELVRQAWLAHGYADHFLQDSFAAGHLVNKTLIMQWFIEWAADETFLPVYDWDTIKTMTAANQPGLAGPQLYSPSFSGRSNDPQTSEELLTQPDRMANTGIVAGGGQTQQQAYVSYLAMLDSTVCQIVTKQIHDLLNGRSVSASSAQAQNFVIFGDDTMLNGGTGAGLASAAAQLSQRSITEILGSGGTDITWQQIFAAFPDQVMSNGSMISLEDWHAPGAELWDLCHSSDVFDSWTTWGGGGGSHLMDDMGIVSVDQVFSNSFQPAWSASQPVGWLSSVQPAACVLNGSTFVFYLPEGGTGLAGIAVSSPIVMSRLTLPPTGPVVSFAAAVMDGQITVAFVLPDGTLAALTSQDGQTWAMEGNFAQVAGAMPAKGLAIAEVDATQYVMYTIPDDGTGTSLSYVVNEGAGWGMPLAVPGSGFGSHPSLATDGETLFVAFQHGDHGIYTGQLASTWTGPSSRPGILTTQGTSLAYVGGTLYLAYWAVDGTLHVEAWNPATSQWSDTAIAGQQSVYPVICTALDSSPVVIFGQGVAVGNPGALAWLSKDAGSWRSPSYALGSFYSDTTPAIVSFGLLTVAFSTVNDGIYLHSFDGTEWSVPSAVTVIAAGPGRLGADVRVGQDDTEILWLAAVQPGGVTQCATFDGTSWTKLPDIVGPRPGTGSVALVDYAGQMHAFVECAASLCWSVYDDDMQAWVDNGPVPAVASPVSVCANVVVDDLYIGYVCAPANQDTGPIYTVAYDGQMWLAPVAEGSDNADSVSIAGFDDKLVMVFLGLDGNLYGQWSGSGGAPWNGKTGLGPATMAPGFATVGATVGDDTHALALLAVAGWSPAYHGQLRVQLTAPG